MAANVRQKVVRVPNNNDLPALLNTYLQQGFVIHQMISLSPVSTNILIVYYDPAVDELPES